MQNKRRCRLRQNHQSELFVEGGGGGDGEFCGNALGGRLAGAGDRLAAADPDLHRARDDTANAVVVNQAQVAVAQSERNGLRRDRESTRLNSSHVSISYAVFCLKKKK